MSDSKPEQDTMKKTQQVKNTDALLAQLREKTKSEAKKPADTTVVLSKEQAKEAKDAVDTKDTKVVSPVVEPEVTNKPVEVIVLQKTEKQREVIKHIALPPGTFQYYNSALESVRMCTSGGIPIIFKDYQLVTDNVDIIAYLEHELSRGLKLQGITRGALLTKEEMDPMEVLRKQIIDEYEASKVADTAAALEKEHDGAATGILTSGNVVTSQDSN